MIRTNHELYRWFQERNIPIEGFTLILNFDNAEAGARFEAAMQQEVQSFASILLEPKAPMTLWDRFTMHGIKVKVESPIHVP